MTALTIPLAIFLPVVTKDVLLRDKGTYAMLMTFSASGAICGALIVAATGHMKYKGRAALLTLVALGALIVGFSLSREVWLTAIFVFLSGVALLVVFALLTSVVQLITPDEMRGRVMSVYNVAFRGGMPMGSLATGQLIPLFTAPPVLAMNGVLLAVLGLWYLLVHRRVATL
jgi:predicted MFS family arabinose efflux permease